MSEEQEEFLMVISDVMPKKARTHVLERNSHEMSRKLYSADLNYCSLMSNVLRQLAPSDR